MLDEIVCHIGMHKTGSSSIQATLNGYDDGETFYVDIGEKNHGIGIYTLFSKKYLEYKFWTRRGYSKQKIDQIKSGYLRKLTSELERPGSRAVISGEDISWLSPDEAKNMVSFFLNYSKKVTVVCYIRDPKSFVASSLQERIKIGMTEFPKKINPKYRFRLEKFLNLDDLIDLVVRKFERDSLIGGSVVTDFCSIAKIKVQSVKELNKNSTLPLAALSLLYLFNRTCPVYHGDEVLLKAKKRMIKELRQKYREWPKIKDADVAGMAVTSDLYFLDKSFGIKFESSSKFSEISSIDGNKPLIENIPDEVNDNLLDLLKKHNVEGVFSTPEKAINRLYMHCVYLEGVSKYRSK